jgi:hypothetical protein
MGRSKFQFVFGWMFHHKSTNATQVLLCKSNANVEVEEHETNQLTHTCLNSPLTPDEARPPNARPPLIGKISRT